MKLPWVGRLAFEQVAEERDRLRVQNDRLIESLTRLTRREAGLPEVPKSPKPTPESMPQEVREYIEGFADGRLRKQLRDGALYRHRVKGEPWSVIYEQMRAKEEGGDG